MKLVNKKTKKAIEKTVRKALKKHGPALVAAIAGSLASSVATLASTESPRKRGQSNLTDVVDRAKKAVEDTVGDGGDERARGRRNASATADDSEDSPRGRGTERHPH